MRHALIALACALALLGTSATALAKDAAPMGDPKVEARLAVLAETLRCLVCQNQTLADSNAELAEDLRNEIRAQIRQNKSDDEIRAYLVARYGDFVLYKPPLKATTWLLWLGPFALLGAGGVIAVIVVLRRKAKTQPKALTPEARARIEAALTDLK
jgi:cytochrome c-type biogenesis protein CcmH